MGVYILNDEIMEAGAYDKPLDIDEINRYEQLSPTERVDTITSILAVAVLRFKHRNYNNNNNLN